MTGPGATAAEFEEFRNTLLLGYATVTAYLNENPEQYNTTVANTNPDDLIYAVCLAACAIANTITGPHDNADCACPTSSAEVIDQLRQELIASKLEDWEA